MVYTFPSVPNGWMLDTVVDYSDMPMRIAGRLVDGMAILYHIVDDDTLVDVTTRPRVQRRPVRNNVDRIYEELVKLIDVPLPRYGHSRVMYVGFPQSGKSLVQFVLLWQSCFVHEKGTVHLLMNRVDSLLQNMSRDYPDLCKKIKDICERLEIPDYQNYIFDYTPFPSYARMESEADSLYTVYVAMANVSQLTRVKELARNNRQTIVFDEADIFIQKEDKPVMNLIQEISSEAERQYECTATPFSNFNEAGQVYDAVIKIPPKSEYRGYDSDKIRHHIVPHEDIDQLTDILEDIFQKDTGGYKNITLVNVDSHIGSQERAAAKIEAAFPGQVIIHVMNSKSSSYERPLSDLMDQIANSDDMRPAVIVAGMMASRAVTFRTSKANPNQAILTSMIYAPSKHANQTTLMQAQRPYGNYDAACPVIDVYCTREVELAVKHSFLNNSAITESVKKGRESRKCIEEVPVKIVQNRKFSSSDDSTFEKLEYMEFTSVRKLLKFVCNKFNKFRFRDIVITSERLTDVPIPEGGSRLEIKHAIKNTLRRDGRKRLHVAWSPERYNQLFSVRNRLQHPHYTTTSFTCGDGEALGDTMPCITWKAGYEDVRTWDNPDIIYIFKTTKDNMKVWIPQQMDKFRKIEH